MRKLSEHFDYDINSSTIPHIADQMTKYSLDDQNFVVELIRLSIPDVILKNLLLSEEDVLNLHTSGFSLGGSMHGTMEFDSESDESFRRKVVANLEGISLVAKF